MRVALCLSGFLRTFNYTFPHLQKHLLSKYNVDIFIHTWDKTDRNGSFTSSANIQSIYKPKAFIIELQHPSSVATTQIMTQKNSDRRDVLGVMSMLYKIMQCNQLKSDFEAAYNFKYDAVIRFRPDIRLNSDFIIDPNNLDKLNIPKYGDFGGKNDQCAYSDSHNMNIYSSLYDFVNYYLQQKFCHFNPEFLLKTHIEQHNLLVNRFDLRYGIMRTATWILPDNIIRCK